MDLSFLEQLVVKYIESHPQVVEKLVEVLLDKLIAKLTGQPVAPAA